MGVQSARICDCVCVCEREREKEGFGKRRNHRKRREKAVALLVLHATNTQMKIQSPTPTNNFLSFFGPQIPHHSCFSITPLPLSLLANFLDSFFFHLLGSMVGKGREGGERRRGIFSIFLFHLRNFL